MEGTPFEAATPHGVLAGTVGGEGDPVVALHGGPGLNVDYLEPMVDELREGFHVATYQQRGLTPSTTEGPFTIAQEVADVCSVMDALSWDWAYVVGHSWGGHLLLHLALLRPDRVLAGLAVDPLGGVGDGGAAAMGAAIDARIAALAAAESDLQGGTARAVVPTTLAERWPGYFADPASAPPMPPVRSSKASSDGLWASIHEEMPGLEVRLRRCPIPILFVAGAESPIPPDASEATAKVMPRGSFVLVDGAGHFPWHERPGAVRQALDGLRVSVGA